MDSSPFPISTLTRHNGQLYLEAVPLAEIARCYGTPTYVYSQTALLEALHTYLTALPPERGTIHYAVKANGNLSLLALIAQAGAGFDIVSGGELARVLAAGGDPAKTLFSGVGKTGREIEMALAAGIGALHVESRAELERIAVIAATHGVVAPITLRINPDIDPETHPYIATGLANSKFGLSLDEALLALRWALEQPYLRLVGIATHIGSQILTPEPLLAAARRVRAFVETLNAQGIHLASIDLGGGIGIRYREETPPSIPETVRALLDLFTDRPERLALEPGRSIIGNAGLLLTRVEYLKPRPDRTFVIVDAAMNDLLRPALYNAWHEVEPVFHRGVPSPSAPSIEIVGPICESSDTLARARSLLLQQGDLVAILSAGAYGMSMSSNYNSRPRAAEVLVHGDRHRLIRAREELDQLMALERPYLSLP